ncbi:hypothetical protein QBZ16_000799 [Prototheca wickerhamii]|uniref:GYF domain-containing protein n=1 Tax=Prototheca wickerhamii TaxID=3111 RepID=A0AAD9IPD9_PROWI|nr:hypothetical protein QBZ16_000799 [Prototheca wickerhamii]
MFGFLWGRGRKGGRRGAGEDEHKPSPFDRQTILETEKFPLPGPRPPFQTTAYDHDDRAVYDYVKQMTVENVWYYRDRMSVPRGPCTLPIMREAWVHGVIDQNTLVWGQGLADWLPIRNVKTLVPQIRTVEVQAATWIKRQFGLKPALRRIRKDRAEARPSDKASVQVDNMF